MKFFLRLILIGTLTYFLSFVLPWWIITIVGFICGLVLPGPSFRVFISGFLGVGLVWLGYAWKLDAQNESEFSRVILELMEVLGNEPLLLIALIGLIGGLCGGFAAMTGSLMRKTKKKASGSYYQ